MSISAALSGLLIEAATTTAVDVISKRSIDPKIRFAGQAWRAFSLTTTLTDANDALRIAAYSDAAGIIAGELVVTGISSTIQDSLPAIDGLNFKLIEQAEGLVLSPDFQERNDHDPTPLDPMQGERAEFGKENLESHGGKLFELVSDCVAGASRAQSATLDLLKNEECREPRRSPPMGWKDHWLDRVNSRLGSPFYAPVPTIGVGSGYSGWGPYRGTYRRDEPEGYGMIEYREGEVYVGQVRQGWAFGYGVTKYPDGRVFAGHHSPNQRDLGVVLSSNGEKAVFGASSHGYPEGFARQIGLSNGVESASGFWNRGELSLETPTLGSIHRTQQKKYAKPFFKSEKWQDFQKDLQSKADEHGNREDAIDHQFAGLASSITTDF